MNENRLFIDNEYFHVFCIYLVNELDYDTSELLRVIEKPWNYTPEFNEFMKNREE